MTSLIWLALALGFIFIEFFMGDLSMLMLGGGALAAAGVSLAGAPLWLDVAVFAVASVSLLLLVRPPLKRRMSSSDMDNSIESHPSILSGKNALVEENVTEHSGLIRIAGDLWTARSLSGAAFHPGEKVVVVQISGNTAYVERALE